MTSLYAMVDTHGRVIGLVEWDRQSDFNRETFKLVLADGAQIGWSYGAGVFSEPDSEEDTDVPW
jgi:hypothetical protein